MDSGSPGLDANCSLLIFLQAIFYVGMGTKMRPFDHLKNARKYLLKSSSSRQDPCVQQIADIWRRGHGVVVLPVATKLYKDDAKLRESAIMSLKDAGLTNLLNAARGGFKGHAEWTMGHWMELGVMHLISAFNLYQTTDQRSWRFEDIPPATDQTAVWQSLWPTAYPSDVVEEETNSQVARTSPAAALPVASDKTQRTAKRSARTTSTGQGNGNHKDNMSAPKRAKKVPIVGCSAMLHTVEVAGTSLQSTYTPATSGAASPQKTVFEAVIKPTTLSQLKDWHSELTKESRSLQIEERVKRALPQLLATMTQVEKDACERAGSRAEYYQLMMDHMEMHRAPQASSAQQPPQFERHRQQQTRPLLQA